MVKFLIGIVGGPQGYGWGFLQKLALSTTCLAILGQTNFSCKLSKHRPNPRLFVKVSETVELKGTLLKIEYCFRRLQVNQNEAHYRIHQFVTALVGINVHGLGPGMGTRFHQPSGRE